MDRLWIPEESPTWDEDKARAFGSLSPGLFGLGAPAVGEPLGDAWWRVEDDGKAVGFGRLDDTWGDAEVLVVVADGHRGTGVGEFVMDHLEQEAAGRSLNYVYNVVPERHPDREGVRTWLESRGFSANGVGEWRRRVREGSGSDGRPAR